MSIGSGLAFIGVGIAVVGAAAFAGKACIFVALFGFVFTAIASMVV